MVCSPNIVWREKIGRIAAEHNKSARIIASFWQAKFWQIPLWWIRHELLNPPKFLTAKVLYYSYISSVATCYEIMLLHAGMKMSPDRIDLHDDLVN